MGKFTTLLISRYLLPCVLLIPTTELAADNATTLSEAERSNRIRKDFNKSKADVTSYLKGYYPELTDSMLVAWEADGSLEMMVLDGEKHYFRNAARNLFRINAVAHRQKEAIDGPEQPQGYERVNERHVPEVIRQIRGGAGREKLAVTPEITYTISVPASSLQKGDTLRCWLPFPQENHRRQTHIELLDVSQADYLLAPADASHRSVYMEKVIAEPGDARFGITFRYRSYPEWFDLNPDQIEPYDTESDLYKAFTAERDTHIRFSPRLRAMADSIAGDESNPLLISRRIFAYINANYPWASAREYSTVENIPEYVISQRHGDCGMVSLLFITLCRIKGIPAKWQSGFMIHPGADNLHDWAEVWFEKVGWVPVDTSFGIPHFAGDESTRWFYSNGIDAYRLIVNEDYSAPLYPAKRFPRSETVDFQRGEVETQRGNLYFDQWDWKLTVDYPAYSKKKDATF